MGGPADSPRDGGVPPDVSVVIREAGERTVAAVRSLCAAQVGADRVSTIREVPFAAALRRGLEVGLAAGHRWTLCLDADVLPRPGAIAAIVAAAEAEAVRDDAVLGVSAQVADPLLGQRRIAGNHLYRTDHLPRTLERATFDAAKRRPESAVKRLMETEGHRWVDRPDVPFGLHDAEQFHHDVFRKVYVHYYKHARFMGYAERYWTRLAPADPDARVALWATAFARLVPPRVASRREDSNVTIDVRDFADNLDALLVPAGMVEKPDLPASGVSGAEVADRLAAFEVSPEYLAELPFIRAEARRGWAAPLARLRRDRRFGAALRPFGPVLRRLG